MGGITVNSWLFWLPSVAFPSPLLPPCKSCSTLVPPGSVNKKARQVEHKQGSLEVGGEERFVEVLLLENVLSQLRGADPDDVHQQKSENTQREPLCPCGRAEPLSGHMECGLSSLARQGHRKPQKFILKTFVRSSSEQLYLVEPMIWNRRQSVILVSPGTTAIYHVHRCSPTSY